VKQHFTTLVISEVCAYCKALFVLVFVGNINEKGYYGRVALHQLHHKVEAQMHTLTDQALVPSSTAADQPVQWLHHHLTLSFVTLQMSKMPRGCKITTQASDAHPHRSGLPYSCWSACLKIPTPSHTELCTPANIKDISCKSSARLLQRSQMHILTDWVLLLCDTAVDPMLTASPSSSHSELCNPANIKNLGSNSYARQLQRSQIYNLTDQALMLCSTNQPVKAISSPSHSMPRIPTEVQQDMLTMQGLQMHVLMLKKHNCWAPINDLQHACLLAHVMQQ